MATKKTIKVNKPANATGKDTVYIDVDDEITNIIDKVKASEHKIIALVLPKRAATLQSVVNMKLLKRAAVSAKKSLVLITGETALLPLAGAAGLHVAKSLQSKPEIPPPPGHVSDETETIDDSAPEDKTLDRSASIGALAAAANDDDTEVIEFDNEAVDKLPADMTKPKKIKKLKHLKVPNFDRFRLSFVLGGVGLVLLMVGWYLAAVVLPKATVTIRTNTTTAVSTFDFTVSKDQAELDVEGKKIPASLKEVKKSDSQKVAATGQKDVGTKATGSMTLKNCSTSDDPISIPAGSKFSADNLIFISDEAVTLPASSFSGGGSCTTATRNVDVTAEKAGESYNVGAKSYSISLSGVQASGSAMAGGTSKVVKVVTQKDIDDAAAAIKTNQDKAATDELLALFQAEELYPIDETLITTATKVTPEPAVNEESDEVTVTSEITYNMLGIKRDDLTKVIDKDVEGEIDTQKQAISDYGIDAAIMRINNNTTPGTAFLNFRTSVTAGPQIDENAVKEEIRGKKRGEIEKSIGAIPGVEEVTVDYSPFWVFSTPKASKKISIVIEKTGDQEQVESTSGNE